MKNIIKPLVIIKISENSQDSISDKESATFGKRIVEITRRDNTDYEWYVSNALAIYSVLAEIKLGNLMPEEFLLIDIDGSEIRADKTGTLERYPEIMNYYNNVLFDNSKNGKKSYNSQVSSYKRASKC